MHYRWVFRWSALLWYSSYYHTYTLMSAHSPALAPAESYRLLQNCKMCISCTTYRTQHNYLSNALAITTVTRCCCVCGCHYCFSSFIFSCFFVFYFLVDVLATFRSMLDFRLLSILLLFAMCTPSAIFDNFVIFSLLSCSVSSVRVHLHMHLARSRVVITFSLSTSWLMTNMHFCISLFCR